MAVSFVAPGVYSLEQDLSLYVPSLSSSILGIVGAFRKGRTGRAILVTNRVQFEQEFGAPLPGELGFAAHAAIYFLRWGNQMRVVRVGDADMETSSCTLNSENPPDVSVPPVTTDADPIGWIKAISPGVWADGIVVVLRNDDVPVMGGSGEMERVHIVEVHQPTSNPSSVTMLEQFTDVVFTDPISLKHVEKVINGHSQYILFDMSRNTENLDPQMTNPNDAAGAIKYVLSGGNDGNGAIGEEEIIAGLQLLSDPTKVDLNLLSVPGFNHMPGVANEIIAISQSRADTMAILDCPDTQSPSEMVDFVRGTNEYSSDGTPAGDPQPLPSVNRAAIFGPWVLIFDPYNKQNIWVPPSVRQLGVFAYNDAIAMPWYAAAGANRGVYFNTLQARFNLGRGDVELIYGYGNNINPVVPTVDGILCDGNKTLQRQSTLMQDINVVRMVMYMEKVIATAARYIQWEPHDPTTWRAYVNLVTPFLEEIASGRGLTQFRIKCDSETNTPYYINRGQMICEIHVIPTTAAAIIINRYIIHPQGASLENSSAVPTNGYLVTTV